jgi:hypothetical protein
MSYRRQHRYHSNYRFVRPPACHVATWRQFGSQLAAERAGVRDTTPGLCSDIQAAQRPAALRAGHAAELRAVAARKKKQRNLGLLVVAALIFGG